MRAAAKLWIGLASCVVACTAPAANREIEEVEPPGEDDEVDTHDARTATRRDASVAAPRDARVTTAPPAVGDSSAQRDASGAVTTPPPVDEACTAFALPPDCAANSAPDLPSELRCTGLYGDWDARAIACGVQAYTPAFELWSDGAKKRRFVALPRDATIDVSDPEAFVYPVGTQFWKEFSVATARGEQRAETRLLRKTEGGWRFTTYVWSEDGQRARRNDQRVHDLFGSGHTVPEHADCAACHEGRRDLVLGWDYLLLGRGAEGVTRESLHAAGRLTIGGAPAAPVEIEIPGDAVERAALGYLHVNCGVSCHSPSSREQLPASLRLDSARSRSVQSTPAVQNLVNHRPGLAAQLFTLGQGTSYYDIRPGDVSRSLIVTRMEATSAPLRMPRLGSSKVDVEGVRSVSAWIASMTPARGYPAAEP